MKGIKRLWKWFWRPSARWSLGALILAGVLFGTFGTMTSNKVLEWTNSEAFCTSCHTMEYNLTEYTGTVHDVSKTGIRATCSQCHVPEQGLNLIARKIEASNDVYQHFIGKTIDTPEKFEERRGFLAMREWGRMKESDSAGCRSCHTEMNMDLSNQNIRARTGHTLAKDRNQTCIDCHKGIAHELPANWMQLQDELNEKYSDVLKQ